MSRVPTRDSSVLVIDTEHIIADNVTVVTITYLAQGDMLEAKGTAVRHPHDKFNADTGVLLATARAYENMAATLNRRANGLVKHSDDVAAHRKYIRANQQEHNRRRRNAERRQARAASKS